MEIKKKPKTKSCEKEGRVGSPKKEQEAWGWGAIYRGKNKKQNSQNGTGLGRQNSQTLALTGPVQTSQVQASKRHCLKREHGQGMVVYTFGPSMRGRGQPGIERPCLKNQTAIFTVFLSLVVMCVTIDSSLFFNFFLLGIQF